MKSRNSAAADARLDGDPDGPRLSPSYLLAYKDIGFITRSELRPVRLQLELMKPELVQDEEGIRSTIVVFGSARIPSTQEAAYLRQKMAERLAASPGDERLKRQAAMVECLAAKSKYYEEARRFSSLVSGSCQTNGECDYVIVTGGGPGIMEAANRGAYESGAKSVGLNITLPHEQAPNPFVTPELCFNFHYFAVRKMHFLLRARALVVFPGGFGTFDELFETLTLIQTEKMEHVPVILFGREFWEKAVNFNHLVEEGVISPEDLDLFVFVETADQAWETITSYYARGGKGPVGRLRAALTESKTPLAPPPL